MPGALTLDRTACVLSLSCIAHCAVLPVIAVSLPAIAGLAEAEWVHLLLASLSVVASFTVFASSRDARRLSFVLPALVGSGLIIFAVFAERFGVGETAPTIAGGLLLAAAHFFRIFKYK